MSSTYKNCHKCSSNEIVKIGFQIGIRRYKCKKCNNKFQSKKQLNRNNSSIINQLTFKKTIQI